jgi:hypothetical protein
VHRRRVGAFCAACVALGCGAKTGLRVDPNARDGGIDAQIVRSDAGRDAGPDANVCIPGVIALEGASIEVVFVIDRSGSMMASYAGGVPAPLGEMRWDILRDAMAGALATFDDPRISVGAKFFPSRTDRPTEDECGVREGLDVPIGPKHSEGVISHFFRYGPLGGTPVGPAIDQARAALTAVAGSNAAQFMILATDGEPSCGPGAGADAIDAIRTAHEDFGIDIFVVGIGSTIGLLDEMAIEGGRARPAEEGTRYYEATEPALLEELLNEITRDVALCTFAVPAPPSAEVGVDVFVGSEPTEQDETRTNGWDWTNDEHRQLGLFGDACARAIETRDVRANLRCE